VHAEEDDDENVATTTTTTDDARSRDGAARCGRCTVGTSSDDARSSPSSFDDDDREEDAVDDTFDRDAHGQRTDVAAPGRVGCDGRDGGKNDRIGIRHCRRDGESGHVLPVPAVPRAVQPRSVDVDARDGRERRRIRRRDKPLRRDEVLVLPLGRGGAADRGRDRGPSPVDRGRRGRGHDRGHDVGSGIPSRRRVVVDE
jgi:hypothetical protein